MLFAFLGLPDGIIMIQRLKTSGSMSGVKMKVLGHAKDAISVPLLKTATK
jgi:hypothetical protein